MRFAPIAHVLRALALAAALVSGAAVAAHVDAGALSKRFADHQAGHADSSYALWAVWVLERWLNSTLPHTR